jgi:tetratricopeptide (TPR) repeat protein/uncharacterized caspase-like protein
MRFSLAIAFLVFAILSGLTPVRGQVPQAKPRDTTVLGPQTFAMVMGVSNYKFIRQLQYADKDAEMFRNFLRSPAGGSVPDDNIFMIVNENANEANFQVTGSKWLKAKRLQKGDRLFIYLAGHGDAIDEDQFFYLTYDCNPAGDKNNYLVNGAIRMSDLKIKIAKETGKGVEVYLIMDACRTSELPGGAEGQGFFNSAVSETRAGEIIMLATGAGQESLEDASFGTGHGLFTWYLVDGLNGNADSMGTVDNRITVAEIQQYVQKNVPNVAQSRFRKKQEPYFCCNENSEKVVSLVDTGYLRKWLLERKKSGGGNSFRGWPRRSMRSAADTALMEAYQLFNTAVRESRLTGKQSAEFYYEFMAQKFPGDFYTLDAQSTLAVEFINFAQNKINLYLECKDPSAIQKLRAQIDEDEKTDEVDASLDRMEKVARQEFYETGMMLEKAIRFVSEDDPSFARSLQGRMYFFKARGFFSKGKQKVDMARAFEYAYAAQASEKNAAYVQQTLATLHLENNRTDSAIHYASKAITTAPRWRYPYVTLAFCYKTINKSDSAIRYYLKSIELQPDNPDAYVDLGHYYYSLSRTDSALAYYQRALGIDSLNAWASNNIGWINHDRKEYAKAITFFQQTIRSDARIVSAYNGLGKSFIELGQFDSASHYYRKAFAHYKDQSIVNVYLGNLYRDQRLYDSAKNYYRVALELDPTYEEAYISLGRASQSLGQLDSADLYYRRALEVNPYSATALINIGLVFRDRKRADSAFHYFQQAVFMDPGNTSILNNLGVIYAEDRNFDTAKLYFRRALEIRPDHKSAQNNLLRIFRQLNQPDSIAVLMKNTSLLDPNSKDFINDMGMVFYEQKRYDSARTYIRRALSLDPADTRSLSNMGLVLQGLKQFDSARIYLQRALRGDPRNTVILTNLAQVFRQLKRYDSAGYYYRQQLLSRAGPVAQTWFTLANYLEDMKELDSAVRYYRLAIQADPRYVQAYNNAGQVYLTMESYDSARAYLEQAYRLDSSAYAPAHNLGLLYHVLGQHDQAIWYLQQAVRNDPKKNKAFIELAASCTLAGRQEQAILYIRQGIQRGFKNYRILLDDPDFESLRKLKAFQEILDQYLPGWRE